MPIHELLHLADVGIHTVTESSVFYCEGVLYEDARFRCSRIVLIRSEI